MWTFAASFYLFDSLANKRKSCQALGNNGHFVDISDILLTAPENNEQNNQD